MALEEQGHTHGPTMTTFDPEAMESRFSFLSVVA